MDYNLTDIDYAGIEDYSLYLKKITSSTDILVIGSFKGTPGKYCNSRALNLKNNLESKPKASCLFIITNGSTIQEICDSDNPVQYQLSFSEGNDIFITSANHTQGDYAHIIFKGYDWSCNLKGINFLVLNIVSHEVIDSVNFDTTKVNCPAFRIGPQDPVFVLEKRITSLERNLSLETAKNRILLSALTQKVMPSSEDVEKALIPYIPADNTIRRTVQLANVALLHQLYNYCREHDIDFMLYGGSLLGAIRHKGFIPWDDDIDIWMSRSAFDKLFSLLLDSDVFQMMVLCNTERVLYRVCFKKYKVPFIDIFTFEFCSSNVDSARNLNRNARIAFKEKWPSLLQPNGYYPVSIEFKQRVDNLLQTILSEEYSYDNTSNTKCVALSPNQYISKYVFDISWIYPIGEWQFEGFTVIVPNNYMAILNEGYKNPYSLPNNILTKAHYEIDKQTLNNCTQIIQDYGTFEENHNSH